MLLGFSRPRVIAVMTGVMALVIGFLAGTISAIMLSAVILLVCIAMATIPLQGRFVVEWLPTWMHWEVRTVLRQKKFRVVVTDVRPIGTLALPGSASSLRLVAADDVAYIHDPSAGTLTAALHVSHSAMVLLDADKQAERIAGWSRLLSGLAGSSSLRHVAIHEETIPDSTTTAAEWFLEHWTNTQDWASREYWAFLETSRSVASTHRTTLTVTVRVGRRGLDDACSNLASQRENLEMQLRNAGLRVGTWLDEEQLARQIRSAYAPFSPTSTTTLASAGPVAIDESWGSLRHDDGFSAVLVLAEFPAVPVGPQFLHSLIFSDGARHTFTLIARVQGVDAALRQVRREKIATATNRQQKAKMGQIEEMSDRTEFASIEAREMALLQGHASVELTALVVVSTPTQETLEAAVVQVKRDAGQCACEARVLYGMQGAAFIAAALPVGRAI
jgi:hypothetical protein